jgi:hypothetical protein
LLQAAGSTQPAGGASSLPVQQIQEKEWDLLLYAVELDGLSVTDGLAAYGQPDEPHLPVGELSRLLELDLEVDAGAKTITGTIGEGRRPLSIDLKQGLARVAGRDIPLASADTHVTETDIYVRGPVLSAILGIAFEVDAEALTMRVVPQEKLPLQMKAERTSRMSGLDRNLQTDETSLKVRAPYKLLSPPSVDFVADLGSDSRGSPFSRRLDVRLAGDLLFTGLQAYVGTDDEARPTSARFMLERRSAAGRLPLGARRISAGDVFSPSLALGPRGVSGRGLSFSTVPLDQFSVFHTIDLRGELPIGHDVELYVNDVLRSGQKAAVQGRYEFLGVPLVRGLNIVRIVTYGPKGERSESTRVLNVGTGQLQRGKTTLEGGVVQQEEALLELQSRGVQPLGLFKKGAPRLVAQLAHGLTSNVTLIGGAALFSSVDGNPRQMLSGGIRTSLLGAAVQADVGADHLGGTAGAIGVAGQPFGISALARHSIYRGGFIDETAPGELRRPRKQSTSITADLSVPLRKGVFIPVAARLARESYADGGSVLSAGARTSATLAETLVSHALHYEREKLEGATVERLAGTWAATRFLHLKWQLRGGLGYEILPQLKVRSAGLTADREISRELSLRFGLAHAFQSRETILQAGGVLRSVIGDLGVTADYVPQRGDWRINFTVGFGAIFNPVSRRYVLTPPGAAAGASAVMHSYLDKDSDGKFGSGDEAAAGIAVEGGARRVVTDRSGQALVTGLGSGASARMRASVEQAEAFYVRTPPSAIEFEPRPGQVIRVAYPLAPVGEVYIRVLVERNGSTVGLSAVKVRLVPQDGEPVIGTTEFDGTVVLPDVPLGKYRLELDPVQSERLRMRLAEEASITVGSEAPAEKEIRVVFNGAGV